MGSPSSRIGMAPRSSRLVPPPGLPTAAAQCGLLGDEVVQLSRISTAARLSRLDVTVSAVAPCPSWRSR
jgi:hypothetical protein